MEKSERRAASRIPLVATVSLTLEDRELLKAAEVRDVSLDGLYVVTTHDIPLHCVMLFSLIIIGESSSLSITGEARTVRKGNDGVALRFSHLKMDSYLHLKNIVHFWQGPASS